MIFRARSGIASVRATAVVGFLTLALAAAACDRTYLTPSHGRAFRRTFAVQTVNPEGRNSTKPVLGLDSQEAAIIAGTYRRGLAPAASQSATTQDQVLTVAPRSGGMHDSQVPASSVPSQ